MENTSESGQTLTRSHPDVTTRLTILGHYHHTTMVELSDEQQRALDAILEGDNVFLTGCAGYA